MGESEDWIDAFTRECESAEAHTALWPLLIGTWKRKTEEEQP